MFCLADHLVVPGRGDAAGPFTTIATASAFVEAQNNNTIIDGEGAGDITIDELFDRDVDYDVGDFARQFEDDILSIGKTFASASAEALNNTAIINDEGTRDSTVDELLNGDADYNTGDFVHQFEEDTPSSQDNGAGKITSAVLPPREVFRFMDLVAAARPRPALAVAEAEADEPFVGVGDEQEALFGVNVPAAASSPATAPSPAADAEDDTLAPANSQQQNAVDNLGAPAPNGASATINAPALNGAHANNDVPVKRGPRRPCSKTLLKPKTTYRCRYGCVKEHGFVGNVALRKHMMRVHCIFSAGRKVLPCPNNCGRWFDPNNHELICNRKDRFCSPLKPCERALVDVVRPRDADEEADTFAYEFSGTKGEGPSRRVIIHEGDEEDEWRQKNADAIKNWVQRPAADTTPLNDGLPTPSETSQSPPNNIIDLTDDDEDVPAPPTPAYEGKKRGHNFLAQQEPKRVMREFSPAPQVIYTSAAQAAASPAPQDTPMNSPGTWSSNWSGFDWNALGDASMPNDTLNGGFNGIFYGA
jgi:hypothetical protein